MNGELQDGGIIPRHFLDVIFNSIVHFQVFKK
jgi:hypothetical protein